MALKKSSQWSHGKSAFHWSLQWWRWSWLALSIRYSLLCVIPIFLSLAFEKKPGSSPTNRIYSGTTKSCKSEHAIMAGYVQVHKTKGKGTFIVGERMSGGLLTTRVLLVLLSGGRAWELPLQALPSRVKWGFCLLMFFFTLYGCLQHPGWFW